MRELLNYRTAFEFVSDYLDSGVPVSEGFVREIHKRLVKGVRGGGEFTCWPGMVPGVQYGFIRVGGLRIDA